MTKIFLIHLQAGPITVAALANFGFTREKFGHKWVQATFNRELIKKRKIYPGRIKNHLLDFQFIRNEADY